MSLNLENQKKSKVCTKKANFKKYVNCKGENKCKLGFFNCFLQISTKLYPLAGYPA